MKVSVKNHATIAVYDHPNDPTLVVVQILDGNEIVDEECCKNNEEDISFTMFSLYETNRRTTEIDGKLLCEFEW